MSRHPFNLTGMKAGQSFLGCERCAFQLPSGVVAKPECPNCLGKLSLFTVRPEDLEPKAAVNRFLPGVVVREASDPTRLYLVTATSDWGFEIKGFKWIAWDKAAGWQVLDKAVQQ